MVSHKTLIIYFFIWRNSGIVIMGRMEKTYIRKREKKYAIYSLFDKKRLTKYYDNIERGILPILEEEIVTAETKEEYKYMLGFRLLNKGVIPIKRYLRY